MLLSLSFSNILNRSGKYCFFSFPEDDMKLRPHGWTLPRPNAIHHMVEDFLTEWDGPVSHVQPLRRFLEHCVQTDLRAFSAGTVNETLDPLVVYNILTDRHVSLLFFQNRVST